MLECSESAAGETCKDKMGESPEDKCMGSFSSLKLKSNTFSNETPAGTNIHKLLKNKYLSEVSGQMSC